ncbi:MAG: TRAP transporter TatT component family protein [Woeseia sp.]
MSTMQGISVRASLFTFIAACLAVSGCATLMSSAATGLAEDLSAAVLNQNDPELVRDGAPAYLLLLDSILEGSPDDPELLIAAAKMYATYGTVFADDPERSARLTSRAIEYAQRGVCNAYADGCDWNKATFDDFEASLVGLRHKHAEIAYGYSLASLAYTLAHSDDWNAIARLPHLEALLLRYLEISKLAVESDVYTYLGILLTLRPAALGGKPEQARSYFERSIELTGGTDLAAKVEFAQGYARLLYDRELHDRLLNEVIAADPNVPGLTLSNVIAQRNAADLLASADEYF